MWVLVVSGALLAAPPAALYEYDVAVGAGARELTVEARLVGAPTGCLEVGDGAEPFVADAQVKRGRRWRPLSRTGRCFDAAGSPLGEALLASPPDRRWWLAGTIKRDEWNGGNAAEMHLEDAAPA